MLSAGADGLNANAEHKLPPVQNEISNQASILCGQVVFVSFAPPREESVTRNLAVERQLLRVALVANFFHYDARTQA
jgi:hypothetical protein